LDGLQHELDVAHGRATEAQASAEAAEIARAAAAVDAAELRTTIGEAQRQATAASVEVERLRQANAARQGRGRWARLRAAWLGE
jgi:hypothetical protein